MMLLQENGWLKTFLPITSMSTTTIKQMTSHLVTFPVHSEMVSNFVVTRFAILMCKLPISTTGGSSHRPALRDLPPMKGFFPSLPSTNRRSWAIHLELSHVRRESSSSANDCNLSGIGIGISLLPQTRGFSLLPFRVARLLHPPMTL